MKLFSPIVLSVALAVAVLSVAVLLLEPTLWPRAVLSLVFLPVGGMFFLWVSRRNAAHSNGRKALIRIRAAMVGAGAVLASALGFRVAEALGVETDTGGQSVIGLILVLVVVCGDLLAARMDSDADKMDTDDQD
ncbi:MAG: hypothetical protein VX501_07940 [Pseudomonadota bacterium]|nr:hypothetical protein [Pseudomonadota bacterium]